ncbi:hypothetical protein [Kaistella rhinocerotis]|uniref:hypothetical protein n=1 Tax=Kaistella rhinocerotis TaxID=3026437 RepID=UPI002554AD47|nr:hypothetical protein [Kaistella sp. Ran72]
MLKNSHKIYDFKGKQSERDGFQILRMSVENGVPCLTSMDTVEAILKSDREYEF